MLKRHTVDLTYLKNVVADQKQIIVEFEQERK